MMLGFSRNEITVSLNPEEIFGQSKIILWSSFLQADVNTAVLQHEDKAETILLRTFFFLPGVLGSVPYFSVLALSNSLCFLFWSRRF